MMIRVLGGVVGWMMHRVVNRVMRRMVDGFVRLMVVILTNVCKRNRSHQ